MLDLLNELGGSTGAGVRVAIVDSGVEASHPWVGGRLTAAYAVSEASDYEVVKVQPSDSVGHGTACAGQIRRFAPDVELISVQMLGGNLRGNSQSLLAALRWLTTQDVNVVNLSLSTMRPQFALLMSHAVDDLYARNVPCICAQGYHLTGKAYPTNFAGSIGVWYSQMPAGRLEFRPFSPVQFNAAGSNVKVAWNNGGTRLIEGSSFACPLVSGLTARILSIRKSLTPYEVETLLKAYAERQAQGWWEEWMNKVDEDPVSGPISQGC